MATKRKRSTGAAAPKRQTASVMLRVRLTPKERDDLSLWASGDVSEYVRTATRRYHEAFCLTSVLEDELTRRALTTFECNLLGTLNPEHYMMLGGAELTKLPGERRKA
jgi:hypothetical protein